MDTIKLLDNFINSFPNSHHPSDERRYNKFIISAYINKDCDSRKLEEILREAKSSDWNNIFNDEQVVKRVIQFEHSMELLDLYENWIN